MSSDLDKKLGQISGDQLRMIKKLHPAYFSQMPEAKPGPAPTPQEGQDLQPKSGRHQVNPTLDLEESLKRPDAMVRRPLQKGGDILPGTEPFPENMPEWGTGDTIVPNPGTRYTNWKDVEKLPWYYDPKATEKIPPHEGEDYLAVPPNNQTKPIPPIYNPRDYETYYYAGANDSQSPVPPGQGTHPDNAWYPGDITNSQFARLNPPIGTWVESPVGKVWQVS